MTPQKPAPRVFIIHRWDGSPETDWCPWLKTELESRGAQVVVPQLPDAENPRISTWVSAVANAVGAPDASTYFVGHSLGCQAIARYLVTLPTDVVVGGAVFVAGYFKRLAGLEDNASVHEVAHHWMDTPLDLSQVRSHLPKSVAIFSDNDPYVPVDNQRAFQDVLGSRIVVEHNQGHFTADDGVLDLPSARDAVWSLMSE